VPKINEYFTNLKLKAPISYHKIYDEDDKFSISLFLLQAKAAMPLHDHPDMWVASLALAGTAKKISYTIKENKQLQFTFLEEFTKNP
jgi:hypothetical protein